MSQWRRESGVAKQLSRRSACRYCPTSGIIKKMQDTVSRVRKHFQDLWAKRKKNW